MLQRPWLRVPRSRRDLAIAVIVAATIVGALLPTLASGARKDPRGMGEFLWGLAGQESGWDYKARNRSSGAYGKYQVMPQNWPHWAEEYLGDRWADQTPHNQELLVRAKIAALHRWLGSWRRVAYWWLSGNTERDEQKWSDTARSYVKNIMALAKRAPEGGDPVPPAPAADRPPAERGDWRLVVDGAVLFDRLAGPQRRQLLDLRDGQVVFVQGVRWSRKDVLWMRVSTVTGRVGWLSIRRTVPAHRPDDARRYPRGDDPDGGVGGGRDDSPRRPRPR